VIGGPIEHDVTATGTAAADRDLALVRFTSDGGLDTGFGTNGIVRLDLATGVEVQGSNGPTLAGADFLWRGRDPRARRRSRRDRRIPRRGVQRERGAQRRRRGSGAAGAVTGSVAGRLLASVCMRRDTEPI